MRKIPKIKSSTFRWIVAIALSYGFMLLIDSEVFLSYMPDNPLLISALLPIASLVGLFILDRNIFKELFYRVTLKDLITAIATALVAIGIGMALSSLSFETAENPIVDVVKDADPKYLFLLLAIQLFWEELIRIIPFLLVYSLSSRRLGKKTSILLAWIFSSLLFGALHLPTYDYNFIQSALLIGSVTFILNYSYIKTKNLFTVYLAHVIYDGLLLGAVLLIPA